MANFDIDVLHLFICEKELTDMGIVKIKTL